MGDLLGGHWSNVYKFEAEVTPIDPPNSGPLDLNRTSVFSKDESNGDLHAGHHRMIPLDAHAGLRQVCHDAFPDELTA
jgi:hypothetical protein